MADPRRVHIYVSGIVQGVFFRSCTQETAAALNITGWVRNLRDGRVEMIAEGRDADLQKLIEWCRRGPPGAVVEDVAVSNETPTGEFTVFGVKS
jgi:acylphosphatase